MPSKHRFTRESMWDPTGSGLVTKRYQLLSSNWVMRNGRPDLRVQNPHYNLKSEVLFTNLVGNAYDLEQLYLGGADETPMWQRFPDAVAAVRSKEQVALARLKGRMRKGQASLGVTFSQWQQSLGMINGRLRTALWLLNSLWRKAMQRGRKLKWRRKEAAAGGYLEYIFGWVPLIEDIKNAFAVLFNEVPWPVFARGQSTGTYLVSKSTKPGNYQGQHVLYEGASGSITVTCVASYDVTNPNSYLLNRLGLLNLPVVIWDIIPWSFLVGMFVNVSSILKSMTDEVGLTARYQSTTTTVDWEYTLTKMGNLRAPTAFATKRMKQMHKERYTSLPSQSLQVRIPDFDLKTTAMLASLVVQRMKKLNDFISF